MAEINLYAKQIVSLKATAKCKIGNHTQTKQISIFETKFKYSKHLILPQGNCR